MKADSRDTNPDVERVQYEVLRRLGPAERVRLMRSLSQNIMQMSWQAIRRANLEATDDEVELLFVAMVYGEELATRLKNYLKQQQASKV